MKQKQTEAQREAKRLYKLFYNMLNKYYGTGEEMTKEAAIICAKEIMEINVYDWWKKLYKDVISELKKM